MAGRLTLGGMGLIFFDNIYFQLDDPLGLNRPIPPVYEFVEIIQNQLYATPEKIVDYRHSPWRMPFAIFYGFSMHFRPGSMTRQCALAVEGSELSWVNILHTIQPTLISYSKLGHETLLHSHPVTRNCIYMVIAELSQKVTYISFINYIATMGTIDYWFEQDQRVFTNIREVIDLAQDEDGNIDYDAMGWHIGDSISRLILREEEIVF